MSRHKELPKNSYGGEKPKKSLKVDGMKPKPGSVVPLDWDVGHWPFFNYGQVSGGIKIVKFPKGHWRIESTEFPTFDDIDVLVGILKMAEDMNAAAVPFYERTNKYGEKETVYVTPVVTSMRNLLWYCGKGKGENQKIALKRALHRLQLFQATRFLDDGSVRVLKFLYTYEIIKEGKRDKIMLPLCSDFLNHCNELHRMLFQWREIQTLGSQLEKGLFLFLSMNSHLCVMESRLLKFLGIVEPAMPEEGASKKTWDKHRIDCAEFADRKRLVVHRLINEAIPKLVAVGKLMPFYKNRDVLISKKGNKYFKLRQNVQFGMVSKRTEPVIEVKSTCLDDF